MKEADILMHLSFYQGTAISSHKWGPLFLCHVVCTAGEFVWNEGSVEPATCYLLPAPYIKMCDFSFEIFDFRNFDV
jgi:hypothetical protein